MKLHAIIQRRWLYEVFQWRTNFKADWNYGINQLWEIPWWSSLFKKHALNKELIKLPNSQNVNCWSRCEFIRLRIQYGTEISLEIEYQSIKTFQGTFLYGRCLFLRSWPKSCNARLQIQCFSKFVRSVFFCFFCQVTMCVTSDAYRSMAPQSLLYFIYLSSWFN